MIPSPLTTFKRIPVLIRIDVCDSLFFHTVHFKSFVSSARREEGGAFDRK